MAQKEQQYWAGGNDGTVAPHFGAVLGFEHMESQEDTAVIELKVRPEHCNVHGSVHGGVVMSLLDAAGLWAAAPKDGSAPRAATASLNCNFLRGARLGQITSLRAESYVIKRGRSMYFSSISVYAFPGGALIASGQGVYSVTAPRPDAG